MFDLIPSYPVLHAAVAVFSGLFLTLNVERIWEFFFQSPLDANSTALVKRFGSTTVALARSALEMMVAVFQVAKGVLVSLQPVAETALQLVRFLLASIYTSTAIIVNLTTIAVAKAKGLAESLVDWVSHTPSVTPYDFLTIFLPFLLFLSFATMVYSLRLFTCAPRPTKTASYRQSNRRAMQLVMDLDGTALPSRK